MQPAKPETVLGDFDNASIVIAGRTSTFMQEDGRFFVTTEGKDGKTGKFEIKYTFGVTPLQQYLVEFPDGRMQALGIAWDARPAEQGGQRWFSLYPHAPPAPGEPLHWTGIDQVWNYQCAECHSTDLRKGYDREKDTYATTWSEIDVSCEACHGPASKHLAWAEKQPGWENIPAYGLVVSLDERKGVVWPIDPDSGIAQRSKPLVNRKEIDICARCHSRRGIFSEDYRHGQPLLDTHRLSLLSEGLYYPDGQVRDEVYVHGSFLQSKMYHAGVTCSDCHEPHSLALRAEGNHLCLQCHAASKFNVTAHHKHRMDGPAAKCVECHMPETSYMVIDPRRDHSMRIPRPDLSLSLGVPNACNRCHNMQTAAWADAQMKAWYGERGGDWQNFSLILNAARQGNPQALPDLETLIRSEQMPAIIRATLLAEFPDYLSPTTLGVVVDALYDSEDPLIRFSAIRTLAGLDPALRIRLLFPFLDDPVRVVRLEASRLLMDLPASSLTTEQQEQLARGLAEYEASLAVNADRPEALTELGVLHSARGRPKKAEEAYRRAISLDGSFTGAYINLADLLSGRNQEEGAIDVLRQGLVVSPEDADLHHALGLSLVRARRYEEALPELEEAARRRADNARYPYVYAVALHSTGKIDLAISTLEKALELHPYDRDVITALISWYRDAGDMDKASGLLERMKQ